MFAYVDDADILGQYEEDLFLADSICCLFEDLYGVIINCNRKLAIAGLGIRACSHDWPLPWLASPTTLKFFGVEFATSIQETTNVFWQSAFIQFQVAIALWQQQYVTTLRTCRDVQ